NQSKKSAEVIVLAGKRAANRYRIGLTNKDGLNVKRFSIGNGTHCSPTQSEPYEISYTLRTEGTVSTIATHEHMIIDSGLNGFRIAIRGEKYDLRIYKIEWQIYKV